jgi:hypothetical protein
LNLLLLVTLTLPILSIVSYFNQLFICSGNLKVLNLSNLIWNSFMIFLVLIFLDRRYGELVQVFFVIQFISIFFMFGVKYFFTSKYVL